MDSNKFISPARRTLARVAFVALGVLPAALGWLFAPLHFQEGAAPLISVFEPEAFPVAMQIKNFSADYLSASESGLLRETPFTNTRIGGAALRVFGKDAAIGITAPPNLKMVAVVRLDNLSWSVSHLLPGLANKLLAEDLEEILKPDDPVIAFTGRYLVLGSSPKLVGGIVKRLGENAASSKEKIPGVEIPTVQSRGILARIRLSPPVRRYLGLDDRGGVEIFNCALTRIGKDFHLRIYSLQGMGPGQKPGGIFPIASLKTFSGQAPLPVRNGEVLALAATVGPGELQALAAGRDSAATPLQQAWRDMVAQAILSLADGRFSCRVMKSPLTEKVLPVPEIRGAIGTANPGAMSDALAKYAGKLIALFREPGGNRLWEAIRQDTRMSRFAGKYPGARIHLHPLFFHQLEPYWFYRPGGDKLLWGTHFSEKYFLAPIALPASNNGGSQSTLRASWRLPPQEIDKWKTLFLDKAEKHNWVPQESLATAEKAAEWLEKAGKTFPSGHLALSVSTADASGSKRGNPAFYLDMHAVFRLRNGE